MRSLSFFDFRWASLLSVLILFPGHLLLAREPSASSESGPLSAQHSIGGPFASEKRGEVLVVHQFLETRGPIFIRIATRSGRTMDLSKGFKLRRSEARASEEGQASEEETKFRLTQRGLMLLPGEAAFLNLPEGRYNLVAENPFGSLERYFARGSEARTKRHSINFIISTDWEVTINAGAPFNTNASDR